MTLHVHDKKYPKVWKIKKLQLFILHVHAPCVRILTKVYYCYYAQIGGKYMDKKSQDYHGCR